MIKINTHCFKVKIINRKCLLFISVFVSSYAFSDLNDYYPYDITASASNYGNTGILEIPNARFMQEGSLRFNFSSSYPNEFTSLTATPFSWLEATYRYAELKNKLYGPSAYSGNQTLKDKGFDVKVKLINERHRIPALAIGLRDIAGTALFSSEYLVFTKGFGNFHVTTGYGWGLLGSEGGYSNPLESILNVQSERSGLEVGQGGSFSSKSWFSGTTSIFGGVEYDLRKYGLKLKLEYDTSNPDDSETTPLMVRSRFNLGATYYLSKNLHIGAGYERGNQFRVSFQLKGNFLEDSIPKPKPKNVVNLSDIQKKNAYDNKDLFYRSLNKSLRDESILLQAATYKDEEIDVSIASKRFQSITRPAGRTARIVSALAEESVTKINIHSMNGDLEVAKISIHREEFDSVLNNSGSTSEVLLKSSISSQSNDPLYSRAEFVPNVSFPEFNWSMSPAIKHQIGGPEGFYLGQLFWRTDASLKIKRNLVIYSSFGVNIYDTFNDLDNPSYSTIPHVRSDIQDYLREGKNNIIRLQGQYFASPIKDVYLRADFGILEEMFSGIGGEIFYRPIDKKYSFGLTMHRVRQRGFEQRFSLRDYETTTGHFGFYYDLPLGITSQVLAGKYLAGDKGLTLDLSRRFNSGFTLGVFATKTNLSAEEFGEGSFDKGFYVSVPTKLFFSDYTTGHISFGLHPLTKDGGALLTQHNALYSILGDTATNSIYRDWGELFD